MYILPVFQTTSEILVVVAGQYHNCFASLIGSCAP